MKEWTTTERRGKKGKERHPVCLLPTFSKLCLLWNEWLILLDPSLPSPSSLIISHFIPFSFFLFSLLHFFVSLSLSLILCLQQQHHLCWFVSSLIAWYLWMTLFDCADATAAVSSAMWRQFVRGDAYFPVATEQLRAALGHLPGCIAEGRCCNGHCRSCRAQNRH